MNTIAANPALNVELGLYLVYDLERYQHRDAAGEWVIRDVVRPEETVPWPLFEAEVQRLSAALRTYFVISGVVFGAEDPDVPPYVARIAYSSPLAILVKV